LRVLNLVTFSVVAFWMRKHLLRWVANEPFLTLGRASLRVFCAHIFFVFVGLALLVRDVGQNVGAPPEQLHGFLAAALLIITSIGLFLIAWHEVRARQARRAATESRAKIALVPPTGAPLDPSEPATGIACEGDELETSQLIRASR
jgi:hypothetical protein